jgi:uncharacterized protein (TIGR03435 family)
VAIASLQLFCQAALAQQPLPSFEVASIKPTALPGITLRMGHGSLTVSDRVIGLIGTAFDLDRQYIEGAPDWAEREWYDVVAKGDDSADNARIKLMLQSLLLERCRLKFHRETKTMPGYALTVDAKKGLHAKETTEPGPIQVEDDGLWARGINMSLLCRYLSRSVVQAPVVDNTALSGRYEFRLFYADPNDAAAGAEPAQNGSVFAALQEIGLKLVAAKVPVTVLHVDSVERPSQN